MITDIFLNQKRVNICEHTVNTVPRESFGKVPPEGMYMYSITYPVILITSPTTILNWPINLFCPLETALVLTSDNFHLIFPPLLPLPVLHPLWWHSSESFTCLYSVFTYNYSFLIKKDFYDRRDSSIRFSGICVCISSGDLFIFR